MKKGICPDTNKKRPVILIGADGFIGSAMHSCLKEAGWSLIPTVFRRRPKEDEIFLDVTDRTNFGLLTDVIGDRDCSVVNVSGLPGQKHPAKLMRAVHVQGMKNITTWARRNSCRHLIQLSSISVYGNATTGTGRTEEKTRRVVWNPILGSLTYGRTKARAEVILERSGLNWSAPRLPAVFGPGDSFITPELHTLLTDPNRTIFVPGDKPVSIISDRAVASLVNHLLAHGALNKAFNAVQAQVPWREIVAAYSEAWNLNPVYSGKPRLIDFLNFSDPGMQMMAYFGTLGAEFPDDLLRRETGWKPEEDWRVEIRQAASALT